jgi:hypothetical protein
VLNLWDSDGMLSSDDYLGTCMIDLKKASTNEFKSKGFTAEDNLQFNTIPKPTWHPIHLGFDDQSPQGGEILCSVIIAPADHIFPIPTLRLKDTVPTKEYKIELNVLGLRELQSTGLLPVRKPFIKFRIKSLLPPDQAGAGTNIETDPNFAGPNPNINTVLSFSCYLPTEELYCPALTCEVFDYIFLGLAQPLIGSFTIPIGSMRVKAEQERADEL